MGIKNKGIRNIRNKNAPASAGLVQAFIDSAYDNVKLVSDNLVDLLLIAEAITNGDFDDLLKKVDIDTLAELNAIVADATLGDAGDFATLAQGILADNSIQAPYASIGEAIGGVDTLRPMNALRVAQAIEAQADTKQNKYDAAVPPSATDDTDAGYTVGSVWIDVVADPHESYRCADATPGAAIWILTTLTTDEMAAVALTGNSDDLIQGVSKLLLTVNERAKLLGIEDDATADQTGAEIKGLYENEADTNAFTDNEKTKLDLIESQATADQTNVEITTAYNAQTPVVSQTAAEEGTSQTAERWTPERVKQAIVALGGAGGVEEAPEDGKEYNRKDAGWVEDTGGGGGGATRLYKTANYSANTAEIIMCGTSVGAFQIDAPASPALNDFFSVYDCENNAIVNNITIDGNGETIAGDAGPLLLDLNGGQLDFIYNGSDWKYSYSIAGL